MPFKIAIGDCLSLLSLMPDQSVHCCVTSPPYFGLRDYGVDGQIGLEETPEAYVARLVDVFREVRRVLRDDGTLWLNIGDSYASSSTGSLGSKITLGGGQANQASALSRPNKTGFGLAQKQLIGIPWRVAFALQADGWYLRQDIIWHKPNPMPESVKDRCTKAHEYVFLLSKSQRYFFDHEAIKEPLAETSISRAGRKQRLMDKTGVGTLGKQIINGVDATHAYAGLALGRNGKTGYDLENGLRNRRSVWTVATRPFKGAHFAVFPHALVEPCVLAGCPAGGTVLDPFTGSGTTGMVALQNGRRFIGCELNKEYAQIAHERIAGCVGPLLMEAMA